MLERRSFFGFLGSLLLGSRFSGTQVVDLDCSGDRVRISGSCDGNRFMATKQDLRPVGEPFCELVQWQRRTTTVTKRVLWDVTFTFSDGYFFHANVRKFDWWWANLLHKNKSDTVEIFHKNIGVGDVLGQWWCRKV